VAEWLGRGLQNLVQRFDSARYLGILQGKPVSDEAGFFFSRKKEEIYLYGHRVQCMSQGKTNTFAKIKNQRLMDRLWQLWAFINAFGFRTGVISFFSVVFQKLIPSKSYKLKNRYFPYGLHLRKNTTDLTIFRQIFLNQEYDFEYKTEPKIIIDCGSNIGMTALYFINRFPGARIICIEPDPSNFAKLVENTRHYSTIQCMNVGIWYKSATMKIEDPNADASAIRLVETGDKGPGSINAVSVQDIMNQFHLQEIDLIKIDIEGSEIELFSHDHDLWLSKVKSMIIELHDRTRNGCSKSLFNALDKYEFNMDIKGYNLIFNIEEIKKSPSPAAGE
jgi:FkbM family methyltransferase